MLVLLSPKISHLHFVQLLIQNLRAPTANNKYLTDSKSVMESVGKD
jgi:hypothetical protein